MADISRGLTPGEIVMLRAVYGKGIAYPLVRVNNYKWIPFQRSDTTMTPNGNMYWNPGDYLPDFAAAGVPLGTKAWFVHEGGHLYQYYGLKWNVTVKGIFERNYNYKLDPAKTSLSDYGIEEGASIAADYYILTQGGAIGKPYNRKDYAKFLPIP